MRLLKFVPEKTSFDFVKYRWSAITFSLFLVLITVVSLWTQALNLGIDFRGGILIEARSAAAVDVSDLRGRLGSLGLGEIELQQFGSPNDVLIRVQQQDGGDEAQGAAVKKIQTTLGNQYDYRRVEVVGPKVGNELFRGGVWATLAAVAMIAVYVALRFEWQFGVAALFATFHDVFITFGLFSLFQLEFNLTAVAALLTLAGYSVNDTVVVFDRLRENLRKYKSLSLKTIINDSVNQTLSRTFMTGLTTMLAIAPLLIYGGETLRNFTIAIAFGIILGTFSSVFVAASLLLYMKPIRSIDLDSARSQSA